MVPLALSERSLRAEGGIAEPTEACYRAHRDGDRTRSGEFLHVHGTLVVHCVPLAKNSVVSEETQLLEQTARAQILHRVLSRSSDHSVAVEWNVQEIQCGDVCDSPTGNSIEHLRFPSHP